MRGETISFTLNRARQAENGKLDTSGGEKRKVSKKRGERWRKKLEGIEV